MQRIILILLAAFAFYSCAIRQAPKDFSYIYDGKYTGLDTLIDINGYFLTPRGCDTSFFTMLMFYPDGLFTVATTVDHPKELSDCFEVGGSSKMCKYPLWGTYRVEGSSIKTQAVKDEGLGKCVVFRDYLINPDRSLTNISDYVIPENTILGYMKNYPSFHTDSCFKKSTFYPLPHKRNKNECPLLKKRWFLTLPK